MSLRAVLPAVAAAAIAAALAAPAAAITAKEKMEICQFGAKDQKLTGKARDDFIKKCMANEDAPPAKDAKK